MPLIALVLGFYGLMLQVLSPTLHTVRVHLAKLFSYLFTTSASMAGVGSQPNRIQGPPDQERLWCRMYRLASNPRQYVPYTPQVIACLVPLNLAFSLRQITDHGKVYTGEQGELLAMSIIYIPCIIYFFVYFLKGLFLMTRDYFLYMRMGVEVVNPNHHPSQGSFALRVLACVLAMLLTLYEFACLLPCMEREVTLRLDQETESCSFSTTFERAVELLFLAGLALFVFFNRWYPRSNPFHLSMLALVCSAAIHAYIVTMLLEEILIYDVILDRHNHTDYGTQLVRGTRYRIESNDECHGFLKCLIKHYLEMFYVAISEFLIVAISIAIAIIFDVGNHENRARQIRQRNFKQMCVWIMIVFLAIALQLLLIVLNVQKADTENWLVKLIFTVFSVTALLLGSGISLFFLCTGNGNEGRDIKPAEQLDRYLLYFGMIGMLCYDVVGIVHCSYLIPTEYSTTYALGSLFVNIFSLIQVLIQSTAIYHRDMVKNEHCFVLSVILWIVNFTMFCLDLFDAATLGIYANPVPHGANVAWTMVVRGLGPFNVFYRFHSLAIIAEIIEDNLQPHQEHGHEGGHENQGLIAEERLFLMNQGQNADGGQNVRNRSLNPAAA